MKGRWSLPLGTLQLRSFMLILHSSVNLLDLQTVMYFKSSLHPVELGAAQNSDAALRLHSPVRTEHPFPSPHRYWSAVWKFTSYHSESAATARDIAEKRASRESSATMISSPNASFSRCEPTEPLLPPFSSGTCVSQAQSSTPVDLLAVEVPLGVAQHVVPAHFEGAVAVFEDERLPAPVRRVVLEQPWVEEKRVHSLVHEGRDLGLVVPVVVLDVVLVEDREAHQRPVGFLVCSQPAYQARRKWHTPGSCRRCG